MTESLAEAAAAILECPDPATKVQLSHSVASDWRCGKIAEVGRAHPPDRPGRPDNPLLKPPREVARRRVTTGTKGRVALLHALAHIELNAIDLAWDIVARFTAEGLPRAFYDDWVQVADEEATHHALLGERLTALDAAYGDLPAHDGLWQAASATAGDLLARLAVVPLVLEARGLDVTPTMIAKLSAVGDDESAAILGTIYDDEIGHVAVGKRWFDYLAERRGLASLETWQALVRRYFKGTLKPPFNREARQAAGFPSQFYDSVASG